MITDILNSEKISEYLSVEGSVEVLETVDSTNSYIKNKSADNGIQIVVADTQTAGHGRYNRKFYSPKGCGIYMSVLFRPDLAAASTVLLTAAAAVAVCQAVEALTEKKTAIKWVNDILIGSEKVCGILAEASFNPKNGRTERAIIGIGLNVYKPDGGFAEEIKTVAGCVADERSRDFRNRLCAEIVNNLATFANNLEERLFLSEYKRRSAVLNKTVTVISGNGTTVKAKALDLDDNCRLLVEYEDKRREYINSGEISIKMFSD